VATLYRPPLVFGPQKRRPIAAPDVIPNLIATTLRNDVLTLTQPAFSGRLFDSAPAPTRKSVRVDPTPNLLTSTLFSSTERIRVGFEQWDDNAPARKVQVQLDLTPNLLGTTLGTPVVPLALPLNAIRSDSSAPWRKTQVFIDLYPSLGQNTLAPTAATLDLPLNVGRTDASAPLRRYVNQVEQLGRAVWRDPVPGIAQLFDSATPRKKQTRVDTTPNPVVLRQPLIARWFESAPPRVKARVMVDLYPSLNTTKLIPPVALAKPLGYPVDVSAPAVRQMKYEIELDFTPNMLVLGITPAPVVVETPRRRGRIVVDKVSREVIAPNVKREVIASPKRESVAPSKARNALTPKKPRTIH
jgi:hypothetical protein